MGKDAGPILRYCQCGAQSAGGAGGLLSLRICGIRRSISARSALSAVPLPQPKPQSRVWRVFLPKTEGGQN